MRAGSKRKRCARTGCLTGTTMKIASSSFTCPTRRQSWNQNECVPIPRDLLQVLTMACFIASSSLVSPLTSPPNIDGPGHTLESPRLTPRGILVRLTLDTSSYVPSVSLLPGTTTSPLPFPLTIPNAYRSYPSIPCFLACIWPIVE